MTWCPHFTDEDAEASEEPRQRGAQAIAGNLEHTQTHVHRQRARGAAQVHQLETAEPFPEPFPTANAATVAWNRVLSLTHRSGQALAHKGSHKHTILKMGKIHPDVWARLHHCHAEVHLQPCLT